jgi:PSP1 C-terminal conserved region
MDQLEYLVGYGQLGDFGRFRAAGPITCQHGDRVVVRSHRGLEIGQVLCPATPRHARYLPNTTVGQLVRPVTAADAATQDQLRERGTELLRQAGELAQEFDLPLELLDVEMLLDGEHAVLHHLRWANADVRPLVSTLSRQFDLHILLQDLSKPVGALAADEEHEDDHPGCGKEGCGSGEGGCGDCGSGGGCGTCGTSSPKVLETYFAGLRDKMEQHRTPLL